jgi:hypothetical protein
VLDTSSNNLCTNTTPRLSQNGRPMMCCKFGEDQCPAPPEEEAPPYKTLGRPMTYPGSDCFPWSEYSVECLELHAWRCNAQQGADFRRCDGAARRCPLALATRRPRMRPQLPLRLRSLVYECGCGCGLCLKGSRILPRFQRRPEFRCGCGSCRCDLSAAAASPVAPDVSPPVFPASASASGWEISLMSEAMEGRARASSQCKAGRYTMGSAPPRGWRLPRCHSTWRGASSSNC